MNEIRERRHKIEQDLRKFTDSVLEEYSRTVYYPARKQLIADCRAQGHVEGHYHNNGLGWTFVMCSHCHITMLKYGPENEKLVEGVDY